jgi:hypothetical protein
MEKASQWPTCGVPALLRASRTDKFTRSIKAVFNLPGKPNCCKAARISVLSSKTHHVRHPHQLASPVAFLHLAVDQALCHLPLTHVPASATHQEPLAKVCREGIEVEVEPVTGKERQAERRLSVRVESE